MIELVTFSFNKSYFMPPPHFSYNSTSYNSQFILYHVHNLTPNCPGTIQRYTLTIYHNLFFNVFCFVILPFFFEKCPFVRKRFNCAFFRSRKCPFPGKGLLRGWTKMPFCFGNAFGFVNKAPFLWKVPFCLKKC